MSGYISVIFAFLAIALFVAVGMFIIVRAELKRMQQKISNREKP